MQIDPRGTRFAAALTTLILCAVLITGSSALLAVQTAIFALGAFTSLQYSPYGWLYRIAIQPRLAPPRELEDARPPRFAQGVGFGFGLVGTVGYLMPAPTGSAWPQPRSPSLRPFSTQPSATASAARCTCPFAVSEAPEHRSPAIC